MPGWRIALWSVLVLIAVLFLYLVRGVILPFIVAIIVAALLEPAVRRLRLRGFSRRASVLLVIGVFYGALIGGGVLLTPTIIRETQVVTNRVQDLTTEISRSNDEDSFFLRWNPEMKLRASAPSQFDQLLAKYSGTLDRLGLPSSRRAIMEQYVDKNRPQIAKTVQGLSNAAFGLVTNLFGQLMFFILFVILVPMFLGEFDTIRRRGPRYIPPAIRDSALKMFDEIGQVFVRYLRGISTVLLLYSGVMTFFLWIAGVPSWILLGPLFGVLYLIPYVGNIISACTVLTVIGVTGTTGWLIHPFESAWTYGLVITGIYLVIGWIFDHLIYPQMVGNSVGLSPVVSMFVIFCGAALFGLPGMLIAFPLAGSVKVILDRILRVTSSSTEGLGIPAIPMRHRTNS